MTIGDIKLYTLNLSTMAISMTQIDDILKMILLLVTIGYTVNKWVHLKKKPNDFFDVQTTTTPRKNSNNINFLD